MGTLVRTYVVDDDGTFTPMATNRYSLLLQGRYALPHRRNRALKIAHLALQPGTSESFLKFRLDPTGKPKGALTRWKPDPALVRALREDAATFSHLARNQPPIQPTIRRPDIDQGGCR